MIAKTFQVAVGALVVLCASNTAFAQAQTFRFVAPETLINQCNLDVVTFTGVHTLQVTRTDTTTGVKLLSKLTSVGTGTGLPPASLPYHMNDTDNFELNINGVTSSIETTQAVNRKLIGPNQGDNFIMQFLLHITITPNGVPAAVVDNVSTHCQ